MRYQNKQAKRQFIAGAVCQGCGATDTTALNISYDENGLLQEYISCTACDFVEHRPSEEELKAMQKEKEEQATAERDSLNNKVTAVNFKF